MHSWISNFMGSLNKMQVEDILHHSHSSDHLCAAPLSLWAALGTEELKPHGCSHVQPPCRCLEPINVRFGNTQRVSDVTYASTKSVDLIRNYSEYEGSGASWESSSLEGPKCQWFHVIIYWALYPHTHPFSYKLPHHFPVFHYVVEVKALLSNQNI